MSKEMSINTDRLLITDAAVRKLTDAFCRDNGVQDLIEYIEKIFEKSAFMIVGKKHNGLIEVNDHNLHTFVGGPLFYPEKLYGNTPPGVVMGLACTGTGGSTSYIESFLKRPVDEVKKEGSIEVTGNLGELSKSSIQTSITVARSILISEDVNCQFFERAHIHIHVPGTGIQTDGPSAGVAIVSSLLSLAFNKAVRQNMAMTGEISVTGLVLPVGGIREKVISARRSGAVTIFIPLANKQDVEILPESITHGIEFTFVNHYNDLRNKLFA